MSFKKFFGILALSFIIILSATISVSAKTQGFTSGNILLFPNHKVDVITGIPALAANASTTYLNTDINSVQRIEAKVTADTRSRSNVGSKKKSVETTKLIVGPNTGTYVIYSFHDVDLGHSRSYFNDHYNYK